ncbi:MAG TPA: RNA polymerase sigma factor [Dehalococcoidia bacterium]|nr:RNA polymerase sigma factor [Dehalococcoidia bacterium]
MRPNEEAQREAFVAEMLPHLDAAYRLARALAGHEQDAEDLVQDTFLRAFRGFARYERDTNARAWLLTIMRRAFLNTRRTARSRPVLTPLETPQGTVDAADTQTPAPEEQVLRASDRKIILDALAGLPEVSRSVLALVDLAGMRYARLPRFSNAPSGPSCPACTEDAGNQVLNLRLVGGVDPELVLIRGAAVISREVNLAGRGVAPVDLVAEIAGRKIHPAASPAGGQQQDEHQQRQDSGGDEFAGGAWQPGHSLTSMN